MQSYSNVGVEKRSRYSHKMILMAIKRFYHRHSVLFYLIVSVLVILISKAGLYGLGFLRQNVTSFFAPAINTISYPLDVISAWRDQFYEVLERKDRMIALKRENEHLKIWKEHAAVLQLEVDELKKQLHIPLQAPITFVTGKIILHPKLPYQKQMVVYVGSNHGVQKGNAVVHKNKVAGRVIETQAFTSRVALINDVSTRVPVILSKSKEEAVVSGANTDMLKLLHYKGDHKPEVGQNIYTSGYGGTFPAKFKVGTITRVDDNDIEVAPAINLNQIKYLTVVTNVQPPTKR